MFSIEDLNKLVIDQSDRIIKALKLPFLSTCVSRTCKITRAFKFEIRRAYCTSLHQLLFYLQKHQHYYNRILNCWICSYESSQRCSSFQLFTCDLGDERENLYSCKSDSSFTSGRRRNWHSQLHRLLVKNWYHFLSGSTAIIDSQLSICRDFLRLCKILCHRLFGEAHRRRLLSKRKLQTTSARARGRNGGRRFGTQRNYREYFYIAKTIALNRGSKSIKFVSSY